MSRSRIHAPRRSRVRPSIPRQVPLQLPRRDLLVVGIPLRALGREEVLRAMFAESRGEHIVALEFVAGLVQVVRQVIHAQSAPLAMRHEPKL